jgi:Spy/CpxP family protein refolding chaperone
MQLTKRFLVATATLALTLSLSPSAFAQGKKGAARGGIPQAFLNKLELTAEQQAKVASASEQLAKDTAAANALTDKKEKRQASNRAKKTFEVAVDATLTPEQRTKLDAMQEQAKEFLGMGPIGNQLVGLDLTGDQKTKILAIRDKYFPEVDKIKADMKGAADKKPYQQQMRQLTGKIGDEVRAVLTPEQLSQLPGKRKKKGAA